MTSTYTEPPSEIKKNNNKRRMSNEDDSEKEAKNNDHTEKKPKQEGLSKKVDLDHGSGNPFHVKKYVVVDGVEVVQKEPPYTVIDYFLDCVDNERKIRLAENEEVRKECLKDFLEFQWQFERFRESCSHTRPKRLIAVPNKVNKKKYDVYRIYE